RSMSTEQLLMRTSVSLLPRQSRFSSANPTAADVATAALTPHASNQRISIPSAHASKTASGTGPKCRLMGRPAIAHYGGAATVSSLRNELRQCLLNSVRDARGHCRTGNWRSSRERRRRERRLRQATHVRHREEDW